MFELWHWVLFTVVVLAMLVIDLGVFHRKAHAVTMKEATVWTIVWIAFAMLVNVWILWKMGRQPALEYFTGYLIEKALSVDNIFVFVLVFSYFRVPAEYQHRVLFWGIIGALIMRGAMIGAGAYLIHQFEWIIYVFGAFLVFTGIRMAFHDEVDIHPDSNPVIKIVRKLLPVTNQYHGQKFFVREPHGKMNKVKLVATPLFVVLVIVETTDLVFAVDSIPAIFAVTTDPFLVFSSNVGAILGLRTLYFLLANVIEKFHFLKLGLSAVLVFVGAKMLISHYYKIPIAVSLSVVAAILVLSVVASLMFPKEAEEHKPVIHDPLHAGDAGEDAPIPSSDTDEA